MNPTPPDESRDEASAQPASSIRLGEDALRHLFAGCCEYAFAAELGIADPPLVDYMVDLLLRFARSDALGGTRDPRGRKLAKVTELISEADQREGRPRRDLLQHVGDVTLFWTGVYPEALPKIQSVDSADFFVDLPQQGRRCYQIVGEMTEIVDDERDPSLFWRIAEEYSVCQEGLTIARREWEALRS